MWQIEFELPKTDSTHFQDALSEVFDTMLIFESEDKQSWIIRFIFEEEPGEEVTDQIQLMADEFGVTLPVCSKQELPDIDWLAENRKDFPAMTIPPFYIHGSHLQPSEDSSLISILVDASLAFGTGEHATTRGCLEVIAEIDPPEAGASILDLGCGTAILAIGMAKLWSRDVWASDIDEDSVVMARQNCVDNSVADQVQTLCADGFSDPQLKSASPYGLIVANILAGPLCELAPQMREHIAPGGRVLLSGLLVEQMDQVKQAYEDQGFVLKSDKIIGDWATLLFES